MREMNRVDSVVCEAALLVGVLLPDLGDPYYHEIFHGIDAWAQGSGYSILLAHTERSIEKEALYYQVLRGRRVDGVIFAGAGIDEDRHLQHLAAERHPVVLLGRHQLPLPSVLPANEQGAFAAVTHLLELGHRRIAMLAGPAGLTTAADRLAGYHRALAAAGTASHPELVCDADFTAEGGLAAMQRLLALPSSPTAVFAANDQMALGAVQAIHAAGLRIPADIAVAGFGDIPFSRYLYPPLTTVRIPLREMGRLAATMLAAQIDCTMTCMAGEMQRVLPVELVCRASTGPFHI